MSRLNRKNDHLYGVIRKMPGRADFSEINFVHNCLPNFNFESISLESQYLGRTHRSPLFINAMTGGTEIALRVNAALSMAAKSCSIPMAVGSQMIALESKTLKTIRSFRIARDLNPQGEIWANLGTYADPSMALRAVGMINADALQIHLNVPQELIMNEGESAFGGMVERIRNIVELSPVPVIAKEVGFGMAKEEASLVAKCGVNAIDVGGKGGTNFAYLECSRSGKKLSPEIADWGLPTMISLLEVTEGIGNHQIDIFVSGGMHNSTDIAKALSLGAKAVGMAGMPLYILANYGQNALVKWINTIEDELKLMMMMTGSANLDQLRKKPLVITGLTAEWMRRRGFEPDYYAQRG